MYRFRIGAFYLAITMLALSCSKASLVRFFKNEDLEEKGIHLEYASIPKGMYSKPFIINFSKMLYKVSRYRMNIEAYNSYTVGNEEKVSSPSIDSVSNFLDPYSKFKDSWFGVFIIIDDRASKGRRFFLKEPQGDPADPENFSVNSMIALPEMDQKIILISTHQNHKGYRFRDLEMEFNFGLVKGTEIVEEIITCRDGEQWLKVTGSFDTVSALTDTRITDMKSFKSIRSYIGLPNESVYELVDPWHSIVIRGCVLAKYYSCRDTNFWAIVYYNGSSFTNKKGHLIDTWKDSDLQSLFQKAFEDLEIGCIEDFKK
jgi:hypothetical protein